MNQEVVLESEKEVKSPEQLQADQLKESFEGYLSSRPLEIPLGAMGQVAERAGREFIDQFFKEEAYADEPRRMLHKLEVARTALSGAKPFYGEDVTRDFNKLDQESARDEALRGMLNWVRTLVVDRAPVHQMPLGELDLVARLSCKGRGEAVATPEEIQVELHAILKKHLNSFSYLRGYEQARHGEAEATEDRTEWMDREMEKYGFTVNLESHAYVDTATGEELEGGDGESFKKGRELPDKIAFEEASKRSLREKETADRKKGEALRDELKNKPREQESVALLSAEEKHLQIQHDELFRKHQELEGKLSGVRGVLVGFINPSYKKDLEVAKEQLAVFNEQIIKKKRQIAQHER